MEICKYLELCSKKMFNLNLRELPSEYGEVSVMVTQISIGEKEKWTNNWTNKQFMADSVLRSSTCHTQFHNPKTSTCSC